MGNLNANTDETKVVLGKKEIFLSVNQSEDAIAKVIAEIQKFKEGKVGIKLNPAWSKIRKQNSELEKVILEHEVGFYAINAAGC